MRKAIALAALLCAAVSCNNPKNKLEQYALSERLYNRTTQKVYDVETNIPIACRRKETIDFEFKEQKLPFLLGSEYKVNDVQSIEKFLKNDDKIIKDYFDMGDYPYFCFVVNKYVKREMEKKGISVALIRGEFSQATFDPHFQYGYIRDSVSTDALPTTISHWYIAGKVLKDGIVNEIIFDYAADQFAWGSIVPVVGTRDALRSLYVNLENASPAIEKSPLY